MWSNIGRKRAVNQWNRMQFKNFKSPVVTDIAACYTIAEVGPNRLISEFIPILSISFIYYMLNILNVV